MNLLSNESNRFLTASNSFLLFLVVFTIFIIPFFAVGLHQVIYRICFTFIFFLSALALSKYRMRIFNLAVLVILIEWSSEFLRLSIINTVSFIAKTFLFILLIILFINQIVKANKVTPRVIMESINGYLMLGISFSILTGLVCSINPTAFSFKYLTEQTAQSVSYISNYIYYSFVTLSTLGYGDIVPLTSAAKSLSIFTSVTGQMYVAIIIALIVSKYLNQRDPDN